MEIGKGYYYLPLDSIVTLLLICMLTLGASGCESDENEKARGRDVPAFLKADMMAAR